MARRVDPTVELIIALPGTRSAGSRPKPPKAGARSASLDADNLVPDHKTAKRRLTAKTVAWNRIIVE